MMFYSNKINTFAHKVWSHGTSKWLLYWDDTEGKKSDMKLDNNANNIMVKRCQT
jgi:hypothetical protein